MNDSMKSENARSSKFSLEKGQTMTRSAKSSRVFTMCRNRTQYEHSPRLTITGFAFLSAHFPLPAKKRGTGERGLIGPNPLQRL